LAPEIDRDKKHTKTALTYEATDLDLIGDKKTTKNTKTTYYKCVYLQRPVFNSMSLSPGVNVAILTFRGMFTHLFTHLFTHKGEHALLFRRAGLTPLGANFTLRGQRHPWGSIFAPGLRIPPPTRLRTARSVINFYLIHTTEEV
jgi:hypothetical protein